MSSAMLFHLQHWKAALLLESRDNIVPTGSPQLSEEIALIFFSKCDITT